MENGIKPSSSFKENHSYSFIKRHGKHIPVVLCLVILVLLVCYVERGNGLKEVFLSLTYYFLWVFVSFIITFSVLYIFKKRNKNVDLLAVIVVSFLELAAFFFIMML